MCSPWQKAGWPIHEQTKKMNGSENSEASLTRLVTCEWVEPSWASTSQRSSSLKFQYMNFGKTHAYMHMHTYMYAHTLKNRTLPLPSPNDCFSYCQNAFHLSHSKILANSREKSSFTYFKSHLITYGWDWKMYFPPTCWTNELYWGYLQEYGEGVSYWSPKH